jgi:sterol desaturase/sphingolipid hydroxylase (fatty acid hydroxylase superfamily)
MTRRHSTGFSIFAGLALSWPAAASAAQVPGQGQQAGQPGFFHLGISAYFILAIAVLGPPLMLLMDALVDRAVSRGWLERAATDPVERAGLQDLKFMVTFVLLTGGLAIAGQYLLFHGRSIPVDLGVHPLEMVCFTMLLLLVVDTNGFFWHRFSHKNVAAFRLFHRGHHQNSGRIRVGVAFFSDTVWDYPLHSGIVLSLAVSLLPLVTGRYPVVTIAYAGTVYVLGLAATHSGLRETPSVKWALRVLLLPIKIVPSAIRIEDHQRHHAQPNCNFGVFFSHWDRLLGSWVPTTEEAVRAREGVRASEGVRCARVRSRIQVA